jgi:hypothetical protein
VWMIRQWLKLHTDLMHSGSCCKKMRHLLLVAWYSVGYACRPEFVGRSRKRYGNEAALNSYVRVCAFLKRFIAIGDQDTSSSASDTTSAEVCCLESSPQHLLLQV